MIEYGELFRYILKVDDSDVEINLLTEIVDKGGMAEGKSYMKVINRRNSLQI